MVVIDLQGEIGWDIWPDEVRKKLTEAGSEDVVVRFSSIGGSVFDGSDIMTLFVDHKRDNPGIVMDLEIKAIAASMGSAIAASPVWDSIGVDVTTAHMIHNPSTFAWGDFHDMVSVAEFLESMRAVYAGLYSTRSGAGESAIIDMMDAETWLFGQAIIDAGFADKIITIDDKGADPLPEDTDPPVDETVIIIAMKKRFEEMKKHQKEVNSDGAFDKDRAAACFRPVDGVVTSGFMQTDEPHGGNSYSWTTTTTDTTGKTPEIKIEKPAPKGGKITEVPKVETKAELREELPAVYDESVQDGVTMERERVAGLVALKLKDEYKDIPEVCAAIDSTIADGGNLADAQTLMNAAMVKIMNDPNRMASLESPGDITTGDPAPTAPQGEKVREV